MSAPTLSSDIKFIVEVENVKEIVLAAEADLAFWQERLKEEALFPYTSNGKAQLILSATAFRWMGTRTNEFIISIFVCEREEASTQDGIYLIQAFNSSRLFAWIERTFFHTPYDPGLIQVEDRVPSRMLLSDAHGIIVEAQMTERTAPLRSGDEPWQGPIFLPRDKAHPQKPAMFFVARFGGDLQAYPYLPSLASLDLAPRKKHPVFQWLLESNLVGKEWRIRNNALHARSRTFTRA